MLAHRCSHNRQKGRKALFLNKYLQKFVRCSKNSQKVYKFYSVLKHKLDRAQRMIISL